MIKTNTFVGKQEKQPREMPLWKMPFMDYMQGKSVRRVLTRIFGSQEVLAYVITTEKSMAQNACFSVRYFQKNFRLSVHGRKKHHWIRQTDYVGDAPNVVNIVSHQEYPKGYSYNSIEIQSETEHFGLTVFLKGESTVSKLEDELQSKADVTFDLIGNLGTITYKSADSKEIIASYERWGRERDSASFLLKSCILAHIFCILAVEVVWIWR